MKKTALLPLVAAAAILSLASPAMAGILTPDPSSPTFTPDTAFTNNTIVLDTTVLGPLLHLTGDATVTPDATNQAEISIAGTYSAEAGDIFSAAYSFTVDLNIDAPAIYTVSGFATVGGFPLPFSATGTLLPGLHKYEGTAQAPSAFLTATTGDFVGMLTLSFGAMNAPLAAAPGTLDLSIQQIDLQLDPTVATVQAPSDAQNISTRANVGIGDNVLIGGIIITGNDTKQVVLRAIGPSSGVAGALADPVLELHDSAGATVATNDNWMDNSAEDRMILTDNLLAPGDIAESALVANLDPGSYTAIVRGAGDTTGVALVEAYDLDNGTTDSQFGNISTRGFVETGANVMIGGFILGGGGGGFSEVIVRGLGPSLAAFGVPDALADPQLDLFDADGNLVASNDNWMDDPNMLSVTDNALAPTDPSEAAIYEILPIGAYTAILSGVGDTTGVGLVESYDLND